MKNQLDRDALKTAARTTMRERRPIDVASFDVVPSQFLSIALGHEEFAQGQDRDADL